MPLPTCECVPQTIQGALHAIYCALYDISVNGAAVNLENITGISDFWKATLGGTPAADQVFGTDGSGVFTTFDITTGGQNLLSIITPADESFVMITDTGGSDTRNPADAAEFLALGDPGLTDAAAGAPFVVVNGIVTSAS